MDHETLVRAVDRALGQLVAAVGDGPLHAPVPTCPEFTVDDLSHHVGEFCGFWAHVLSEGTGRAKPPFVDEPGPDGRVGWLQNVGDQLVAELWATDPATEVWTWHPTDHSAAFVARRCAHELAVHRVDAQLARGSAQPIEAGLAADGIEELFVILAFYERAGLAGRGAGEALHLHGTDHDEAEWMLTLNPGGVTVEREHAKGGLGLRGAIGDLELTLYGRPPIGEVERFGDEAVLEAFHNVFTFRSLR